MYDVYDVYDYLKVSQWGKIVRRFFRTNDGPPNIFLPKPIIHPYIIHTPRKTIISH